MPEGMSDADAEKTLERSVMSMADGIPPQVPCHVLGRELLDTLSNEGRRPLDLQMAMMAASLAAALKIINRSVLNTPTTEKDQP